MVRVKEGCIFVIKVISWKNVLVSFKFVVELSDLCNEVYFSLYSMK